MMPTDEPTRHFPRWFTTLSLATLGTSLFAAVFIAALEVIFVISFTALIYSGDLTSQIPQALGFILLGDAILCLVVALLSSTAGVLAVEQDASGVMLSVVAASVIAALSGSVAGQFATVTVMIVFTTATTGLLLILLGAFKLGGLVRFLPYPIIGGFLAGTGWLLIQGGIGLLVNAPLGEAWVQAAALQLWVPGAVLGAIIYIATKKIDKPYTIPALMLGASLVFYALVWIFQVPPAQLRAEGWLLDGTVTSGVWQFPLRSTLLAEVDWRVLINQLPALIPVAVISVIGLLLNSGGLELIIKQDIDLNRALLTAGLGNLVAGFTGGLVGFQDISFSALNYSMTGGKRLVGILTALLLAATLVVGISALLFIPKFIFGSVLIFLGLQLLVEWVYEAWFKFSRSDFLVVVTILLVIAFSGFLAGIVAGLVLAVGMFAVSYSQVKVVKFTLTGREYHSRVTRSPWQQQVLDAHGDQLYIMKLEGFIFFGTANGILTQLREQITLTPQRTVNYVVLDFAKVSGVDSTGMLSFTRMMQWCREHGLTLVLTGLTGKTRERFTQISAQSTERPGSQFFIDLDRGLEWCENAIIAHSDAAHPPALGLAQHLAALLKNDDAEKFLPYFQRRDCDAGEYLLREGDAPDVMYFR